MNSHLTFEQFAAVIQEICLRQLGFESFGSFIEQQMYKYMQNMQEHTADLTKLNQT